MEFMGNIRGLTIWLMAPLISTFCGHKMESMPEQKTPSVATTQAYAQRRQIEGERKMNQTGKNVALNCRFEFSPEKLTVHYTVTNQSGADIYLLDAFPAVDQTSRTGYADLKGVYICEGQGGAAHLLKGIPPLPAGKTVTVRVMPLGTKLAPGARLERKFDLKLPLEEQSPYYGQLKPEDHSVSEINKVRLTVQYIPATAEDFQADPAHYAPAFFIVRTKHTVGDAMNLDCETGVKDLTLLKRKDGFTRIQ
jgi:hypothetical protein